MIYSKRAFQRAVVLLERKRVAVPRNAEMSRVINARRVMDITFTKGEDLSGWVLFLSSLASSESFRFKV